MKHSLRFKVFRMNILPVAAAIVLYMLFGIFQIRRLSNIMEQTNTDQNTVIRDTMSVSLEEQATENFKKYLTSETKVLNREFWSVRHDIEMLASQVEVVLSHPDAGIMEEISPPSKKDAGKLTLQLMYADGTDTSDQTLSDTVRRLAGLGPMMLKMVGGIDSLMDCVISLPGGASIIADNTPEQKMYSDGSIMPMNAHVRPWYVGALVHEDTYFTPVNSDAFLNTLQVMVGVPVFIDGRLAAVCGGSINLHDMERIVSYAQLGDYTDSCLINETGNIIFSSRDAGDLGTSANNLKSLFESSNAQLVSLVREALDGDTDFSLITIDGEETYIAYAPIETVGWTQLLVISKENLNWAASYLIEQTDSVMDRSITEAHAHEREAVITNLIIATGLLLLAILTSILFANGLVRPIMHITRRISLMQGDDMEFQMDDTMRTGDEIEVMASSFEDMSVKMKGYVREIVQITSEKQRLDTELSVARDIQMNLLPNHFPAFPGQTAFDLYAVMEPAREVGGDFYDFFLIDEDHLALVMADVSGKGVAAALFMVVSRTLIKNVTLSGQYASPADILQNVNNLLNEGNSDDMFVTVWLGILTISTGDLVSACAGHEYPVFYRSGKGFIMEQDPHGMVMGAIENIRYKEAAWKLDPGDMLFLYTDGVPEAHNSNQQLFGTDRMLEALDYSWRSVSKESEAAPDLERFLRTVRRQIDLFAGDAPQFDDLTMLCLNYMGTDD